MFYFTICLTKFNSDGEEWHDVSWMWLFGLGSFFTSSFAIIFKKSSSTLSCRWSWILLVEDKVLGDSNGRYSATPFWVLNEFAQLKCYVWNMVDLRLRASWIILKVWFPYVGVVLLKPFLDNIFLTLILFSLW